MACQRASTGKAPGPDTIPNEVNKFLPEKAHDVIYSLFTIMAKKRCNPQKWCTSATKLIYKPNKKIPNDPANYRPIALMNCILKFWTSILTIIGTQTTESGGIFGDTADGFRSHRNIVDSISTLITMYEDAKLKKKKHIHRVLRLQRRIRRDGPPHTAPSTEGVWLPRLIHQHM